MIGMTNNIYAQEQMIADAHATSLTETLNESAKLANNILNDLNAAHERLFGRYPLGPQAVDNAKAEKPNAASLAVLTLNTLHEIHAALGQHHQRI